ncbi:MAG: S-methyl-5-thioribose-1-phosphate isomerase [Actinobacteria bacterium]|nr:S-methyl-5-thioribose-1-phosphate isomerase [Actinomycetota bacterium]
MTVYEKRDTLFFDDDRLMAIDQTRLPGELITLELNSPLDVAEAIKRLAIRGAMAIGVAGAYGVLLGALTKPADSSGEIAVGVESAAELIMATRPTARNLFWACEIMRDEQRDAIAEGADAPTVLRRLRGRADALFTETIETNKLLVEKGQAVIREGDSILTHCNSGPLAAVRYGTAVGIIIEAHKLGRRIHAFVDETRPLLQGSRLTEWELARAGVSHTVIPDSAAASVMKEGRVDVIITGADRIAANGDAANKIGTYGVAVLAAAHGIPFYIAAPGSTIDLGCGSGNDIVIEERGGDELRKCGGVFLSSPDAPVYNPAFDVTPAGYITGIITEKGVLGPPYEKSLDCFAK